MNGLSLPPASLLCDAPGCLDEIVVRVGQEQLCEAHALQRANAIRRQQGRSPLVRGDDGLLHVQQ